MKKTALCFVLPVTFVSACSVSDADGYLAENASFLTLGESIADFNQRVGTLPATAPEQMPSGSAEFTGLGVLFEAQSLATDAPDLMHVVVGAANITVNFETEAVGGTVRNFFEVDPSQLGAFIQPDETTEDNALRTAKVGGALTLDAESGTVTGTLSRIGGGTATYSMASGPMTLYGPNAEVVQMPSIGTAALSAGGLMQAGLLITAEQ